MEDISVETLGTRLVELRKKYNFTQADIGEKLNVSVQAVSKWENDLSLPDYDYLIKLADLFNTSIDELLGRKKEIVRQEENKDKNLCLFPNFTDKTLLEFKTWYNKLTKYNINIPSPTYIKIDENDPQYNEDKKGMIVKQNIKPNTTLSKIDEIVITYIEK